MPRYDYQCPNCDIVSERFISYQNYGKVDIDCLDCGSEMFRIITAAPRVQWSQFSGTTRYKDPLVEQGLANEKRKYGGIVTDEIATQMNSPGDKMVEYMRNNN